MIKKTCIALALTLLLAGCGHVKVSRVGLLSFGDLEGKVIPDRIDGPIVSGKSCSGAGGTPYYLSDAVRDALKGTRCDTLIDVQIKSKTGIFVWSNAIYVEGKAIDSRELYGSGGGR